MRTLDSVMPVWDCGERHERVVRASPAEVDAALRSLTPRDVRLLSPLMALRLLPGRLAGRPLPLSRSASLVQAFVDAGFVLLRDAPGEEIALGAIGRFWRLAGNAPLRGVAGAEGLRDFGEPGFAKAALDFRLLPEDGATRLVTETRVAGTDERARRLFRLYWLAIRPGSGAIRRSILAAVARRCEPRALRSSSARSRCAGSRSCPRRSG